MGFKTQIAISASADFEQDTWSFEMESPYTVMAGKYAIVPIEQYNEALQRIEIAIEAIHTNAEFAFLKDDLKSVINLL